MAICEGPGFPRSGRFNPLRRSGGRATPPRSRHPPRRGEAGVSIPSAEAGGVRLRGGGGRHRPGCFNPLRRSGGRATYCGYVYAGDIRRALFQSPPPKRGACDSTSSRRESLRPKRVAAVSIPSAEAGGVRPAVASACGWMMMARWFQSPPPKRGACDRLLEGLGDKRPVSRVSIPSAEAGGVRPQHRAAAEHRGEAGVSIPSAEAGGVRPVADADGPRRAPGGVSIPSADAGGVRRPRSAASERSRHGVGFNPLRRSGGRATDRRSHNDNPDWVRAFQSPPPKRGACD